MVLEINKAFVYSFAKPGPPFGDANQTKFDWPRNEGEIIVNIDDYAIGNEVGGWRIEGNHITSNGFKVEWKAIDPFDGRILWQQEFNVTLGGAGSTIWAMGWIGRTPPDFDHDEIIGPMNIAYFVKITEVGTNVIAYDGILEQQIIDTKNPIPVAPIGGQEEPISETPRVDEERPEFWGNFGYRISEAKAIASWVTKNQQSPSEETIAQILVDAGLRMRISQEDSETLQSVLDMEDIDKSALTESEDLDSEEKSFLKFMLFGPKAIRERDDVVQLTVPFAAGGAGAGALFASSMGKIRAGLKSVFGIGAGVGGATTLKSVLTSTAAKGASTIAGVNGMMVWLASDNVLSGAAFTLRKIRDSIKFNIITREETGNMINKVQNWIEGAAKLVEISATANPLLLPFREILLTNIEKAKADFDLEVGLINAEWGKM